MENNKKRKQNRKNQNKNQMLGALASLALFYIVYCLIKNMIDNNSRGEELWLSVIASIFFAGIAIIILIKNLNITKHIRNHNNKENDEYIERDKSLLNDNGFIVGKCIYCGEELQIPQKFERFFCLSCGAELARADIRPVVQILESNQISEPDKSAEDCFRYASEHIASCVLDRRNVIQKITKKEYDACFEEYTKDCREIFEQLDQAVRKEPSFATSWLQEIVSHFIDQVEVAWKTDKDWKTAGGKSMLMDRDKVIIAIFLVPAVKELNLSISDVFAKVLQDEWKKRFPQYGFNIGNYGKIKAAFDQKRKMCFITTAVCEAKEKPDDCDEMTAFRSFRDGYLLTCKDGPSLIREYYMVAPIIVACINCGDNRKCQYQQIWDSFLVPCYMDIQSGRYERCKNRYIRMVRELQKRYMN